MGLPALPGRQLPPEGAHTTYAHKWPQMYAEKGAAGPLRDDRSGTVLADGCSVGARGAVRRPCWDPASSSARGASWRVRI